MEVASPLPFNHAAQAGNKRRFVCSPIMDAPASMGMDASSSLGTEDYAMDDSSGYGHSFKRRRFGSSETMDGINQSSSSSIVASTNSFMAMPFGTAMAANRVTATGSSWKRQRSDDSTPPPKTHPSPTDNHHLQQTIERQTADIQRLTSEKSSALHSLHSLTTTHEKTVNENKILKRAVTIQQERQNQAATELTAAHKYRGEAEEKMRKLEQIILSLRYHLQAQQPCTGNDFMGLTQRPPDVF